MPFVNPCVKCVVTYLKLFSLLLIQKWSELKTTPLNN